MAKQVSFAMRCRSLRKIKGLTQDEVVVELKTRGFTISKSGYQKWEKDLGGLKRPPNIVALAALADLYGVPIHVLVDFDYQKKEDGQLGALEHFVDIDLLPPDKIELLKNLYDNFKKDVTKKHKRKDDADNGEEV